MTEMFGEAWPPMSVPDLAPDDDDDSILVGRGQLLDKLNQHQVMMLKVYCQIRLVPASHGTSQVYAILVNRDL